MENVVLVIHLLLALSLIGVVLIQRSEGGGLGIGGSQGGMMSARRPANPMARVTWGLAIAFIATSLILTVLATQNAGTSSVVDRIGGPGGAAQEESQVPGLGSGEDLLPPSADENAPLVPIAE